MRRGASGRLDFEKQSKYDDPLITNTQIFGKSPSVVGDLNVVVALHLEAETGTQTYVFLANKVDFLNILVFVPPLFRNDIRASTGATATPSSFRNFIPRDQYSTTTPTTAY